MRTKSEERRQHILTIAAEVFCEMGFDAASMAVISARIGGSKATLYNYFSSKDELFAEVMLNAANELRGDALVLLDQDLELKEKLRRFGLDYLKFRTSPKMVDLSRMAISHADKAQIGVHVYERGIQKSWSKVADVLQQAIQRRQLRKNDSWQMAMQLKALLEAEIMDKCYLCIPADLTAKTLKKYADQAIDTFLNAYNL